jgi:hypothetical protein
MRKDLTGVAVNKFEAEGGGALTEPTVRCWWS